LIEDCICHYSYTALSIHLKHYQIMYGQSRLFNNRKKTIIVSSICVTGIILTILLFWNWLSNGKLDNRVVKYIGKHNGTNMVTFCRKSICVNMTLIDVRDTFEYGVYPSVTFLEPVPTYIPNLYMNEYILTGFKNNIAFYGSENLTSDFVVYVSRLCFEFIMAMLMVIITLGVLIVWIVAFIMFSVQRWL
jgi:hypothetical protein